jgi:hypothetical protein
MAERDTSQPLTPEEREQRKAAIRKVWDKPAAKPGKSGK